MERKMGHMTLRAHKRFVIAKMDHKVVSWPSIVDRATNAKWNRCKLPPQRVREEDGATYDLGKGESGHVNISRVTDDEGECINKEAAFE